MREVGHDPRVSAPETLPFPVEKRAIHRILTPEEDALIGHVKGHCHDSRVCDLCAKDLQIHNLGNQNTILREALDGALRVVDSIIEGN